MIRRLYFIEVFALVNLAAIALLTRDLPFVRPSPLMIVALVITLSLQTAIGIGIRLAIDLARKRRGYLRRIRRKQWLIETFRMIVATALWLFAYGWIKIAVPMTHPVLFDQQLFDLDQTLLFGIAPTVLVLNLFGEYHWFLRFIDWSYANIFLISLTVATAFFISQPSRRIREAFVSGNGVMWVVGAWLYTLVPSLGPAYRFDDWLAYDQMLPRTQSLQAVLMRNYQNIQRAARGEPHGPIQIMFGIAAFPSLHVGFQTYVFLWMRRLWTSGEVLFAIFMGVIFLGSMITGWHYLIDGLAGFALALACWWVFWRRARIGRLLRLFQRA